MKFYLEALGCRLNTAEIEILARELTGAGWAATPPEAADVIVLNSCAVTAQAARKTRHRLRALQRANPAARLAVIGCWATNAPQTAASLPGVTWVIPNADKAQTAALLTGQHPLPAAWSPGRWGHTRAFLGVQDGCNHTCTYCLTRILRGPARSRPLADVVADVLTLVSQGAQEIVLTGVSLGAYGCDLPNTPSLALLVKTLLHESDLPRLRLSSIEPWDVDETLLKLWESPRLCRQLHLPLQSGSDTVLRRMGRRSTTAEYAQRIALAREVSPEIAVTTDMIAGFPGETEAEFATTLDFVTALAFARLHVFPYSERTGTPAVHLPDPIPKAKRNARAVTLRNLGKELAAAYHQRFVGQVLPVLWEHRDTQGRWRGRTDNYLAIAGESQAQLYNCIIPTRMFAVEHELLLGEPLT